MAITLGTYSFDTRRIAVQEKQEEVGGRDGRTIQIQGIIEGRDSLATLEAELDAIARAASEEGDGTPLSLREGRRMGVRRTGFTREIARDGRAATFTLLLEARLPFEESIEETSQDWTISESGAELPIETTGNLYALPRIALTAIGAVVAPSFSDGVRTIAYTGVVADRETLIFDGPAGRVTLEGIDVTPYTEGEFPHIAPEGTTLRYEDAAESSHAASVSVAFNDRWW
jgi:hypothetical protein